MALALKYPLISQITFLKSIITKVDMAYIANRHPSCPRVVLVSLVQGGFHLISINYQMQHAHCDTHLILFILVLVLCLSWCCPLCLCTAQVPQIFQKMI